MILAISVSLMRVDLLRRFQSCFGLVPQLGDDVDHNPTHKILDWRLMIEDWQDKDRTQSDLLVRSATRKSNLKP
jgi:hypothetical protein